MKNILGDPVDGENFFGREAVLALLWRKLERQSLILSAPRRVGKTSVMYRMRDQPRPGWRPIHFNVEACATEAQFAGALAGAVRLSLDDSWWEKLDAWGTVRDLLGRIEKVDANVFALQLARDLEQDRWRVLAGELLDRLARLEQRTAILIDEFPYFIHVLGTRSGPEAVAGFLHWFRAARQRLSSAGRVRFIVYGSVGLDSVLRRFGLSNAINDLEVVTLGSFDRPSSEALLQRLAAGEDLPLSQPTIDRMLERLGGSNVPFHLQLIFARLLDRAMLHGAVPSPALVDAVYDGELLDPSQRKYFAHWDERLDTALPKKLAGVARRLLSAAAANPRGIALTSADSVAAGAADEVTAVEVRRVVDLLLHDGYLLRSGDRLGFASALLRDWWRHWYPES